MANEEHLKFLKQGAEAWNKWRKENPWVQPSLFQADLHGANLENAFLTDADLRFTKLDAANLKQARLDHSNLGFASLVGADLSGANLELATLMRTNLEKANLSGALLGAANFLQSFLTKTNFGQASLYMTTFADTDLGTATGLHQVKHLGPSTIGINTLYKSKGRIPEIFLRGCGLPDEMIEFARSIAGSPIEFNSCFISYSTKDEEFAQRLYNDLQASGVRCWFAPHDMKGGKKLRDQIDWAIHYHDRTLLILSPDSINSHWVKTEIAKARKRELEENRQVLFPIRLVDFKTLLKWEYFDADTGTDYAKEIREYFIPDFSNWKDHDSYQAAFKKLLQDLRGERSKAESGS